MPKAKKVSSKKLDELIESDRALIDSVHGDTSVSLEQTIDRLNAMRDYCNELVDLCISDIERRDSKS